MNRFFEEPEDARYLLREAPFEEEEDEEEDEEDEDDEEEDEEVEDDGYSE
jgi:hypothetical protein